MTPPKPPPAPPPPPPVDQSQEAVPSVPPVPAEDTREPKTDGRKRAPKGSSGGTRPKPAKEAGTGGTDGTASPKSPRAAPLQKRLEEFFATPALIYSFAGDEYGAAIIAHRTPAMAAAWYELAKVNPGVKRVLERLTESSAWGAVVLSSASVVVPLLGHHGVIPHMDPWAGVYPTPDPVRSAPIVPPPPQTQSPSHGGEGRDASYAPPVGDAPPGTVTVAGLKAMGAFNANGAA